MAKPPKTGKSEKTEVNKLSSTSSPKGDINSILAKPEYSQEDLTIILDTLKNKGIDPKTAFNELTKPLEKPKDIKNPGKVAENLKEATKKEGEDSTKVEEPVINGKDKADLENTDVVGEDTSTTKTKPTEESVKETSEATTKESTVKTSEEPKKGTTEKKAKKAIDGFDSNQFTFKDAANQELYNLALTNGIGTPIKLSTGEMAIPIKGTGRSMVVSDKFAKTFSKVKLDDPKEVSATLAQMLGGSPVKGYDAYNYANNQERAKISSYLDKINKKIDESSLSDKDKETTKEFAKNNPSLFKRLFVVGGGGLLGIAGLGGMGLYNDNEDQNTIEDINDLNNRLNQDNLDGSGGTSGGGDNGDYPINIPNFGDPGNTANTLQSAAAIQPESEDTIGENQEYVIPDRGHTSEDFKQGNPLADETRLVTKDTPESTPYNPSYTPKDQMYNTGLSSPIPEQVAEQLAGVANTETPSKSNKKRTKTSKATSGNNAPMAGSRPDVSAPGYDAAALSAALGQAAQGAPVDGYDRMFDPSFLEYMRRVSPNTAYGIEQEMRRRGMM